MIGGIGHLGSRVSALLDGDLDPVEAERAWAHVHGCHACRDLVEREGWVKRRLARLSDGPHAAPAHLKGSLLGGPEGPLDLPAGAEPVPARSVVRRTHRRLAVAGGGAVGAALLGSVIALGASPAAAPTTPTADLRGPVDRLSPGPPALPGFTPALGPGRSPGPGGASGSAGSR